MYIINRVKRAIGKRQGVLLNGTGELRDVGGVTVARLPCALPTPTHAPSKEKIEFFRELSKEQTRKMEQMKMTEMGMLVPAKN